MRLGALTVFLLSLAAAPPQASAAVATLGLSAQNFTLTGIGANANGQGQSKMTWGTCTFDGTNTSCTLSGPYTGFGGGGNYSFVITYPGNGAFPLNAITNPGSDLFTAQATGTFSLTITLVENNRPTVSFYSFANFNFQYSAPTCTGVATCRVGEVGLTPNATITGKIIGAFDPTPTIVPSGVITAGNYGAFQAIAPAIGGLPAFVDFISPAQVNVQAPSGLAAGQQQLVITTAGGSSLAYSVTVKTLEPGLLAPPAFILGGRQNVVALFANTLTYVLPASVPGVLSARARVGDTLTLYGIGFGTVTPDIPAGQIAQQTNDLQNKLQVAFAGVPANVTYAGFAPGYVGLYQFNVVVPSVAAGDSVPLTFTVGSTPGPQNLVIAVQ